MNNAIEFFSSLNKLLFEIGVSIAIIVGLILIVCCFIYLFFDFIGFL